MTGATQLTSVGIDPPPGFDVSAHNGVHEKLVAYKDSHPGAWRSFSAAWKGLVYRYRAAHEYSDLFSSLVVQTNSPPPEDRYSQDHALFSFSVCALSALECFYFGAHCIGSVVDSANFSVSSARDLRFYPRNVANSFGANFPNEPLTLAMQQCISSPEYPVLEDHRNVLTHRGIPPRSFHAGGEEDGKAFIPNNPKEPSSQWLFTMEINANTTEVPRQWLLASINRMMQGAEAFCTSCL